MVVTLLERLEEHVNVDCDTLDTAYIQRMPIVFHDQTSNPKVVHTAITAMENRDILEAAVKELQGQPWDVVYITCLARIAAKVAPLISGKLLSQTSPSSAYDRKAIISDARRRYKAYIAAGIPSHRIAIKIATTTAGVQAAKTLASDGIPTLGTMLSSVPQALAAAQAGMFAISMWYNSPAAHTSSCFWYDVADPVSNHPMSATHALIRHTYDLLKESTGRDQPQMKTCAFVSSREVLAMPALGADHVTVGPTLLEDLTSSDRLPRFHKGLWKVPTTKQMDAPGFAWEDWIPPLPSRTADHTARVTSELSECQLYSSNVDYLADGVLDKLNNDDEITRDLLQDALAQFISWESKSQRHIESLQAKHALI